MGRAVLSQQSPQIVYGTYLGGRHKDCATAVSVDSAGNAFIVGRTPSPDFPVTRGAFRTTASVNNDDWVGVVSKVTAREGSLGYSSFIGGNYRSTANAIAVNSSGEAFVVGSTCSTNFPVTPNALLPRAPGSDKVEICDGFLAVFSADGSHLIYGTYLGGSRGDAATAVASAPGGNVAYIAGYTASPDFPITPNAAQQHLNEHTHGFLSAIDVRSGQLLYSTFLGGSGTDQISSIALAGDGSVYVSGVTDSQKWPGLPFLRFGRLGAMDGFVIKLDPSGKTRPIGLRLGGSGDDSIASIAVDAHADVYAAGTTNSRDFPVRGHATKVAGSGFVAKIDSRKFASAVSPVVWSRRVGGHAEDALLSVSAAMAGSIFIAGRSGSVDFPVSKAAIHRRLVASNDSVLVQLSASDGHIRYATFLGGTRQPNVAWYNDEATGVYASPGGDVYITGCTLDDRLPVTPNALQPKRRGNSDLFLLHLKFTAPR